MELGMIGLGRMGSNMARRLLTGGHRVAAYDPAKDALKAVTAHGAVAAGSIEGLVGMLARPRAVWLMVPAGAPTQQTLDDLSARLSPGDTVIDGGNSYYRDSMLRAASLVGKGILLLDVGTSGGVWGLKEGYCLMVGGDAEAYRRMEPAFRTLAPSPDSGYAHVGPSGAGHFVKMVHNGIEYGLMQAYAEGFELMRAKREFNIDLAQVAEAWRHGSVIRSWLLDLAVLALKEDPDLKEIEGYVADSGEGRWTAQESIELAVPAPVMTAALYERFRSQQAGSFGHKLLAALRKQFGGHPVRKAGGKPE